jgi:phosphoribosylanthranilate isomerase
MFVKVCGTTSEEDALLAVALGADAVGFIFAPSPRQIAPALAADIVKRLPPEILTVGVFRNETPERVVEIVNQTGLRAAQLHGRETPEQARFVRERVPFLIKVFLAGDPALTDAASYGADAIMIDAPSPGSGQVFDWRLTEGAPDSERLILAGGLDPTNVADAIALVHPWGVDVATGVERRPGRKHAEKLRAFIAAAKAGVIDSPPPDPYDDDALQRAAGPYDWQDDL